MRLERLCPFPVGAMLFLSGLGEDPNTTYPGTQWDRVEGVFPLASDADHPVDSTGGEEEVTLTVDQMPVHTHLQNAHTHTQNTHSHTVNGGAVTNGISGGSHSHTWNGYYSKSCSATGNDKVRSRSKISSDPADTATNASTHTHNLPAHTHTCANATATNKNTTATNQNAGGGGGSRQHAPVPRLRGVGAGRLAA